MGDAARFDDRLKARIPRIVAASALMGAVIWAGAKIAEPMLAADFARYFALLALVALGMAAYFAIGSGLRAFGIADLKGAVRR